MLSRAENLLVGKQSAPGWASSADCSGEPSQVGQQARRKSTAAKVIIGNFPDELTD